MKTLIVSLIVMTMSLNSFAYAKVVKLSQLNSVTSETIVTKAHSKQVMSAKNTTKKIAATKRKIDQIA